MNVMNLNILDKGISLFKIGINEYAYSSECIELILSEIRKLNLIILGGDVYIEENNVVALTYDSWYYSLMNTPLDCVQSIDKAREYIYRYIENNGNNYYFSFVLDNL